MIDVTLLTTENCGLCDQAKEVLGRLSAEFPLRVQVIDVASGEGRAIAERALMAFPPAVLIEDQPFSYGRLSERKLRKTLLARG